MHWTRRVGLLCLGLFSLGLGRVCPGQDNIAVNNGGVVYLDDFSGSVFLSSDGGNYLLFHKVVGEGVGHEDGYSRLGVRTRLWEDFDRQIFGEVHALITDDARIGYNIGGGIRKAAGGGILGFHGWYDDYETGQDNRYRQITGGFEYLHPVFDLRSNAYIPIDERENFIGIVNQGTDISFLGNNLVSAGTVALERAYYGWDFEGGGPVPLAENWLRAYAGIYQLIFDGDNATGFRARAEARFMEGVNLNLMVSEDDKYGTNVNLGVEVRFRGTMPTRFQSGLLADRRYDQVRRVWPVQTQVENVNTAIPLNNPGTDDPIQIVFVDNTNSGGTGTFEDPLEMLPGSDADADLFLVNTGSGSTFGNLTLMDGQQVLGAGKPHFIDTEEFGVIQLPSTFNQVSGNLPTLESMDSTPIITLANDNVVRGFNLIAENGIAGDAVDNFLIECLHSDVITNGVVIDNATGTGLIRDVDFLVMGGGTGVSVTNSTSGSLLDVAISDIELDGGASGVVVAAGGGNVNYNISDIEVVNTTVAGLTLSGSNAALNGSVDGTVLDDDGMVVAGDSNVILNNNLGNGVLIQLDNTTGISSLNLLEASDNGTMGMDLDGVKIVAENMSDYTVNITNSTIDGAMDDGIDSSADDSTLILNVDPTSIVGSLDNSFEFSTSNEAVFTANFVEVDLTGTLNDAINGMVLSGSNATLNFSQFDASGAIDDGLDVIVRDESSLTAIFDNSDSSTTFVDTTNGFSNSGSNAINVDVSDDSDAILSFTDINADNLSADGNVNLTANMNSQISSTWTNGSISDGEATGVTLDADGAGSGIVATFNNVAIDRNAGDGIDASLSGGNASSVLGVVLNSVTMNENTNGLDYEIDGTQAMGSIIFNEADLSNNVEDAFQFDVTGGAILQAMTTVPATPGTIINDFSSSGSNAFQGTVIGSDSLAMIQIDGVSADGSGAEGALLVADSSGTLSFDFSNGSISGSDLTGISSTSSNNGMSILSLDSSSLTGNGEEGIEFDVVTGGTLALSTSQSDLSQNGIDGSFSGVRGSTDGPGSSASVSFDSTISDMNTLDGFEFDVSNGGMFIGEFLTPTGALQRTSGSQNLGSGITLNATDADTVAALIMNGANQFNMNNFDGLQVTADGIDQLAIMTSGNFDDNVTGYGINIDASNITTAAIDLSGSTNTNRNAAGGINLELENSSFAPIEVETLTQTVTVDGFSIDGATAAENSGTGINITGTDLTIDELEIVNSFSGQNMGDGFHIDLTNSTINTLTMDANISVENEGDGVFIEMLDSQIDLLNVVNNSFGGNTGNGFRTDLDNTPVLDINISNNDIGVTLGSAGLPLDDSLPIIRPTLGLNTLQPNDDLSSALTPLGFDANFFGQMFDSLYVNTNGNVTFDSPLPTFTPFGLLSTSTPIIAPFFADVDTRFDINNNATPNVMFGNGLVDGQQAFFVNWIDVRHFSVTSPNAGQPTNTFQLVLIDRSDINAGDFDIEFNYQEIQWEAGEASGSDQFGLGGSSATVGFSNGVDTSFELNGSAVNGAFLDSGPAATSLVQNSINSNFNGRYIFFARDGQVSTAGTDGNGGDGIQINAINNSDIGNLTIDTNRIEENGGQGIAITANTGSDIDLATVSNNEITDSGSTGIMIDIDDSVLTELLMSSNNVSAGAGAGVDINVTNGTSINNLNIDNNTIDANLGGTGLSLVLDNTDLGQGNIESNTVTGNGGDGVVTDFNMTTGGALTFLSNEISGHTGAGLTVTTMDSTFTDLTVDDSLIQMNTGGDGILFDLTNSSVSNALTVSNSFLEENGGNGLELDLDGTPIANLMILDNLGAAIPPSDIGFSVDVGAAQHWNLANLSPSGTFLTNLDFNLAPAGVTLAVSRQGGSEFELFGGLNVTNLGVVSVNGMALDDTMVNQPGVLTEGGTTVDFVFNDFNGGEFFNHFDIQYGPGTTTSTMSGDLLGATATATFSTGETIVGTFDANGQINAIQMNPGIGAGIFGNAENGILLSAANGSDIGAMTIDGNRLDQNALGGIIMDISDSTLPGTGAPSVVSNNIITAQQNGDGISLLTPDTNGNAIGMDFINNTISDTIGGSGLTISLDDNAGGLTSEISGNTISNNDSFGVRIDAIDDVDLNLTIGDSLGNTNVIDGNTDAGVAVTMMDDVTSTITLQNTTISNTTNGTDGNFAGQGLAIRLMDNATLTDLTIGDPSATNTTIMGSADDEIQISVMQNAVLTNPTIQNVNVDGAGTAGDGLDFVRTGDATVDNFSILTSSFSNNRGGISSDGIAITVGQSNKVDEFLIMGNTIDNNFGRGIDLEAQFDADIFADIQGNTITNNGGSGIRMGEVFVDPILDSRTITANITGNTISGNTFSGVRVDATHDLTIDGNTIDSNGNDGVTINVARFNAADRTEITNNDSISGNGTDGTGFGVNVAVAGEDVLIQNNIAINGNASGGISSLLGSSTEIRGNNINMNGGDGIEIVNGVHTIDGNTIEMNTGDGIELISNNTMDAVDLVVNSVGGEVNTIRSNEGRGLNLLVQGTTIADVDFSDDTFEDNTLEGVYVVNTASTTQGIDAPATNALASDGSVFATPELVFNFDNNDVLINGTGSGFAGTGLVIRVGTSGASTSANDYEDNGGFASDGSGMFTVANLSGRGGILANITDNNISGLPGADVLFESFVSTTNPGVTAGTWDSGTTTYDIAEFTQDPLARFDLNFTGNTGGDTDIVRAGASFTSNEDEFKSRDMTQTNSGPFASGTRLRNAQRQADRSGAFLTPVDVFLGTAGDPNDFQYSGVGEFTFRRTGASSTVGFGAGDDFTDAESLGAGIGELPFGWGTF